MNWLDALVLFGTLIFIVAYGTVRTRKNKSSTDFLRGDGQMKWWQIGISVMATQASAITFISTPGQAYESGLGFIQFYLGLPLAMIVISVFFIPIFYKLNVVTAYEFLESRFDLKVRWMTALFFLVQRGLAAGLTIYAPSIILSTVLGINLNITNLFIGGIVVIYTVSGGAKAVNVTQQQQMAIMIGGMLVALGIIIYQVTRYIGFREIIHTAGALGKFNAIDWKFDPASRYNIWSGLIGGFFLSLAYFGTDQSQVGRYLGGESTTQSRLGLLFNGIFKIPMQLLILFVGVMVFVFYLFVQPPVYFNKTEMDSLRESDVYKSELANYEAEYDSLYLQKNAVVRQIADGDYSRQKKAEYNAILLQEKDLRDSVKSLAVKNNPGAVVKDTDYVFVGFVMDHLPHGVIGLLFAVIFCAAMSSKASELNALAASSVVDFYKRLQKKRQDDAHYVKASKAMIILWGALSIGFATVFSLFDNLIQAVNIIGSLFYGTMLGVFVVGFFMKHIRARAVFIAGIITELLVILTFILNQTGKIEVQYLWLNPLGCVLVMIIAQLIEWIAPQKEKTVN